MSLESESSSTSEDNSKTELGRRKHQNKGKDSINARAVMMNGRYRTSSVILSSSDDSNSDDVQLEIVTVVMVTVLKWCITGITKFYKKAGKIILGTRFRFGPGCSFRMVLNSVHTLAPSLVACLTRSHRQ